jgi:ferredoxin
VYRIEIDRLLCSAYGTCIDLAPDLIELDDELVAIARVEATAAPTALDAARSCPMGAITLVETASESH